MANTKPLASQVKYGNSTNVDYALRKSLLEYSSKEEALLDSGKFPVGQKFYIENLGIYRFTESGIEEVFDPNSSAFRKNMLWPGAMLYWPMGHTRNVLTTGRLQIPCGVSHSRIGFEGGTTIFDAGDGVIHIQRVAGNNSTASHTVAFTLYQTETFALSGKNIKVHYEQEISPGYTGVSPIVRLQCSNQPQQSIVSDDGKYTNGHTTVAEWTGQGGIATIPNCVQLSLVITLPYAGVAGAEDWVRLKNIGITIGHENVKLEPITFTQAEIDGLSRYRTTYPYGVPRGTNTEQGSLNFIAQNTRVNWAGAVNWSFNPPMIQPPKVIFQSPTSSQESRWLNKDTGTTVNGLSFNVSEHGVTITNNGVVAVNDRLLCQATAEVLI